MTLAVMTLLSECLTEPATFVQRLHGRPRPRWNVVACVQSVKRKRGDKTAGVQCNWIRRAPGPETWDRDNIDCDDDRSDSKRCGLAPPAAGARGVGSCVMLQSPVPVNMLRRRCKTCQLKWKMSTGAKNVSQSVGRSVLLRIGDSKLGMSEAKMSSRRGRARSRNEWQSIIVFSRRLASQHTGSDFTVQFREGRSRTSVAERVTMVLLWREMKILAWWRYGGWGSMEGVCNNSTRLTMSRWPLAIPRQSNAPLYATAYTHTYNYRERERERERKRGTHTHTHAPIHTHTHMNTCTQTCICHIPDTCTRTLAHTQVH